MLFPLLLTMRPLESELSREHQAISRIAGPNFFYLVRHYTSSIDEKPANDLIRIAVDFDVNTPPFIADVSLFDHLETLGDLFLDQSSWLIAWSLTGNS